MENGPGAHWNWEDVDMHGKFKLEREPGGQVVSCKIGACHGATDSEKVTTQGGVRKLDMALPTEYGNGKSSMKWK